MKRRTFLGCGASLSLVGARALAANGQSQRRLLVLLLRGGMDGLSAIPPLGDPELQGLRGSLVPPDALPGNGFFGVHPALPTFAGLMADKQALAIHAAGDIFGEMCLSGLGARAETAVAMQKTVLKEIPCGAFFTCLDRDALVEGFVRYLAVRVADQQQIIVNLVTVDSEQRLGKTLLRLGRTMGKRDPHSIRIELKITHEELSDMVGATGPRISILMKRFHSLGLLETNAEDFFVIKEVKLADYLAQLYVTGNATTVDCNL